MSRLTISRRDGEAVQVVTPSGETILILVEFHRARQVKLSFECDRSIKVLRTELLPLAERRELDGNR